MTSQPLPSEFPYIWGKLRFLLYQCVLYLEYKQRRRAHLSHAGPEGPAVGVDVRGILFHDAEVPKGLGVLRLAADFHELRLVGGGLCLALHFHELRLRLGKEGLAHGQTLQEILAEEKATFSGKFSDEKKDYPAFSRDNLFLTKILNFRSFREISHKCSSSNVIRPFINPKAFFTI